LTSTINSQQGTPPLSTLYTSFEYISLSNEQMAHELALNGSDVQQMTAQLREGIVKKSPR